MDIVPYNVYYGICDYCEYVKRPRGLINGYEDLNQITISHKKGTVLYETLSNNQNTQHIPFHFKVYHTVYWKVYNMDVVPLNVYYGICDYCEYEKRPRGVINGYEDLNQIKS